MPDYKPYADCQEELTITQEDIDSSGEVIDPTDDPVLYAPLNKKITVPKGGVCKTIISADTGVTSNVGFGASEWQKDIFTTLTKLEEGEEFDGTTSQISYKNTFYWNREAKDGDVAGRVLVKPKETWYALFVNNNKNEDQTIKLEYGAAVHTVLAYSALASTLLLSYVF